MMRFLKTIIGRDKPRRIATIRHAGATTTILAPRYRASGNARQRSAMAGIRNNPMQDRTYQTAPLLKMAGVMRFDFHWPSAAETIRIGALLHERATGGEIHR